MKIYYKFFTLLLAFFPLIPVIATPLEEDILLKANAICKKFYNFSSQTLEKNSVVQDYIENYFNHPAACKIEEKFNLGPEHLRYEKRLEKAIRFIQLVMATNENKTLLLDLLLDSQGTYIGTACRHIRNDYDNNKLQKYKLFQDFFSQHEQFCVPVLKYLLKRRLDFTIFKNSSSSFCPQKNTSSSTKVFSRNASLNSFQVSPSFSADAGYTRVTQQCNVSWVRFTDKDIEEELINLNKRDEEIENEIINLIKRDEKKFEGEIHLLADSLLKKRQAIFYSPQPSSKRVQSQPNS